MRAAFAALVAATATGIEAQQGSAPVDPVIAHFREYRAALERDDLPAAEAAAGAALAASEAAAGRRTAILALNLANLRLELGPPYDALPPARTAHALAAESSESGVDPVVAALTLGRAELDTQQASSGAARLLGALAAAEADSALEADAYNAAVALGRWGLEARDYDSARRAWAAAARLAHTTGDAVFARATALASEGAAIALGSAERPAETGAEGARLSAADAQAANDAFTIAQRLLQASASAAAPDGELAPSQRIYAQAMALQSALLARIEKSGAPPPAETPAGNDAPARPSDNFCRMRTLRGGELSFSPDALDRYGVGAVVLHVGLDETGAVASRTVAAALPSDGLAAAVEKVADEWRLEKDPTSPPGCRIPASTYVDVRFMLE